MANNDPPLAGGKPSRLGLDRRPSDHWLADEQEPDQGGWLFVVFLALIYVVLQTFFRMLGQ